MLKLLPATPKMLKHFRKCHGITQKELSWLLGISLIGVKKIEKRGTISKTQTLALDLISDTLSRNTFDDAHNIIRGMVELFNEKYEKVEK